MGKILFLLLFIFLWGVAFFVLYSMNKIPDVLKSYFNKISRRIKKMTRSVKKFFSSPNPNKKREKTFIISGRVIKISKNPLSLSIEVEQDNKEITEIDFDEESFEKIKPQINEKMCITCIEKIYSS